MILKRLNINYLVFTLAVFAISSPQSWAASSADGSKIYQRNCVICHGADGISTMANAPSFKRGQGLFKSDFALIEHLQRGKNACPSFMGILREKQMRDVIAYIRTLFP